MKKGIIIILIILLVVAGLLFTLLNREAKTSDEGVVAIVNGENVNSSDLEAQLDQAKQFSQQELSLEQEAQLREQLLDQLIGSLLLKQAAQSQGISVDEEEVNSQLNQMIETLGGEESFNQQLSQSGLTREELQDNMKEQLLVQKYIESAIPSDQLEITEEEMKSYYDQMVAGQQGEDSEVVAFEEMEEAQKEQLELQLQQQKRSMMVQQLIQQLKQNAEISKPNQE